MLSEQLERGLKKAHVQTQIPIEFNQQQVTVIRIKFQMFVALQ